MSSVTETARMPEERAPEHPERRAQERRPEIPDARRFRPVLLAVAAGTYLAVCGMLLGGVLARTGHRFVFALDDPYIHMELARNLAAGHYGLNPGEAASPSSSLLWPLLLAPFARSARFPQLVLALNLAFGLVAALCAAMAVAKWRAPGVGDGLYGGEELGGNEKLRRVLSVVALVFVGNLAGLTFLGMEHTLQVAVAALCALGVIAALRGRAIPLACLIAAGVAPSVRYECLGLTLAVAAALWGQNRKRAAGVLMAAAVAPLVGFSVFLHHLGLPLLPMSVLAKGGMTNGDGALGNMVARAIISPLQIFLDPERLPLGLLSLTLIGLAWRERRRERRFALRGAAAAAVLHLVIGRIGWFYRYEVYILFFAALVALHVLHERPRIPLGWYALALAGCCSLYVRAAKATPDAAEDVYLQQYQTHRFLTEFSGLNAAVNDLGLAAYERRPGQYVFDLVGLGSVEANREHHKDTAWLDRVTREHNVGVVALYPQWFPPVPADWTKLGQLCLENASVFLAADCVSYYATPQAPLEATRAQFAAFTRTLPAGVIALGPEVPAMGNERPRE